MSTNRSRRIDRATAEQLLSRGAVDVPAGQDALADVLAAAAAPATQGELAGEQAALAAFRAASLGPAPKPRRRSMVSSTLAKLLSAKVAAVGAIALGGVAVAAGTGHLPAVLPGGTTGRTTATVPSAGASPSASGAYGGGSGVGAGSGAGTDLARLVGLCRAYGRGTGERAAAAAADPAFSVLVREAGDRSRVVDYCAGLLLRSGADGPTASATDSATDSATASATADHGKGHTKGHPGGGPPTSGGGHGGSRPSTRPTPHGSGRPGSAPDSRSADAVGRPAN